MGDSQSPGGDPALTAMARQNTTQLLSGPCRLDGCAGTCLCSTRDTCLFKLIRFLLLTEPFDGSKTSHGNAWTDPPSSPIM